MKLKFLELLCNAAVKLLVVILDEVQNWLRNHPSYQLSQTRLCKVDMQCYSEIGRDAQYFLLIYWRYDCSVQGVQSIVVNYARKRLNGKSTFGLDRCQIIIIEFNPTLSTFLLVFAINDVWMKCRLF